MNAASTLEIATNLTRVEFNALMTKRPDTVLLDVRTPAEVRSEALEGAVTIDFMAPDFPQNVAQLDKSKLYLVYCRSGNRSGQACQIMHQQGFIEVYNLGGGLMNWPY